LSLFERALVGNKCHTIPRARRARASAASQPRPIVLLGTPRLAMPHRDPPSLSLRARAHAEPSDFARSARARLRAGLCLALLALPYGCNDAHPSAVESTARAADAGPAAVPLAEPGELAPVLEGTPARRAQALAAALSPPPADETSDVRDAWMRRRKAVLLALRRPDTALGIELMRRLREEPALPAEVRRGFVQVIGSTGAPDAPDMLSALVGTYGPDLGERRAAAEALADCDPRRAHELLGPLVVDARKSSTYPPNDALLEAWLRAVHSLGIDPTPSLARIATDLHQDDGSRHLAVRRLGERGSPAATHALEAILIESTGNAYLRRLAAQGLVRSLARADACAILRRVADREADPGFLEFLANLLEANCA